MFCPQCGKELGGDYNFCRYCGKSIGGCVSPIQANGGLLKAAAPMFSVDAAPGAGEIRVGEFSIENVLSESAGRAASLAGEKSSFFGNFTELLRDPKRIIYTAFMTAVWALIGYVAASLFTSLR